MRTFHAAVSILLATLPGLGDSFRAPADDASAYECRFTEHPIDIDGRLDEPEWQHAPVRAIENIHRPANSEYAAPRTEVRFLWSTSHLYAAFSCEDDDIWSFSGRPDDTLWLGDAVELFLKPSRATGEYAEFVVAPNGALADARYPSRGAGGFHRFKTWSSGAQCAVMADGTDDNWRDDDRGFTVEMAIPWSAFDRARAPDAEEEWSFGAFRYEYSKSRADPLLLMSLPRAGTWGFHEYEHYQPIRFVRERD